MFAHGNPSILIGRARGLRFGAHQTFAARDLIGDEPTVLATDNDGVGRTAPDQPPPGDDP